MRRQATLKAIVIICCLALPLFANAATGNISPTNKYAWSETGGWVNFKPTSGGVSVYDDHLEGKAWSESIGWIKLGSYSGGGTHNYTNTTNADWGVNRSGETLSGYAWSETAGWVNFSPTGGGVTIAAATGVFSGKAWSEGIGWISFNGTAVNTETYTVTRLPNGTITYSGNGQTSGEAPTDGTSYIAGASVILSGNSGSLAKTGYTFAGWNSAADGSGSNYAAGGSFTVSGDSTLYAVWGPQCATRPIGLAGWWRAEGNAVDAVGGNNGTFIYPVSVTVGENKTATAVCPDGYSISAYTSTYYVPSYSSRTCGTCIIGATSCSVAYNNSNCGDPYSGLVKSGTLAVTCSAGAVSAASGKVGQAFSFNGTGGYISEGTSYSRSILNSFSMEFWAKPEADIDTSKVEATSGIAGVSGQRYAIFPSHGSYDGTTAGAGVSVGTNGIAVAEHTSDYLPLPLVYALTGNDKTAITAAGGWVHVAVVYDNKTPKLYINGVLKRTGLTSPKTTVYPSSYFGDNGQGYGYYKGALDEVHIFNRVLSDADVQLLYNSGVTGVCQQPSRQLTVNVTGSGSVTGTPQTSVTGYPGNIACVSGSVVCSADYPEGAVIDLAAEADSGYTFTGWTGACSDSAVTCRVTMDQKKSVSALFELIPTYSLTISINGKDGNKVESTSPDQQINCTQGGTSGCIGTYEAGAKVTLAATATAHSSFSGWNGELIDTVTPSTVTMDGNRAVTATFASDPALVRIYGSSTDYYALGSTLDVPKADATLQARSLAAFVESIIMTNTIKLLLKGGYADENFTDQSGYTTVSGSLKVKGGTLKVERVKVK